MMKKKQVQVMMGQMYCFFSIIQKFQLAEYIYIVHFWGFIFTTTYKRAIFKLLNFPRPYFQHIYTPLPTPPNKKLSADNFLSCTTTQNTFEKFAEGEEGTIYENRASFVCIIFTPVITS